MFHCGGDTAMAAELAKLPWLAHLSETVWRNPVTGFVICFLSFDPSIAQQGLFELGLLRQIKRTHPFAASEILQKLPVAMVEGRSQAMTLRFETITDLAPRKFPAPQPPDDRES